MKEAGIYTKLEFSVEYILMTSKEPFKTTVNKR